MSKAARGPPPRDDAQVTELLAANPELDVFEAAALGRAERLQVLLEDYASLANAYGDDGFQPLLLDHGSDPNTLARNEHMRTNALPAAAASENKGGQTRYELCELLLKHGADPSIPQGGNEFRAIDSARLNGDERLEPPLGS